MRVADYLAEKLVDIGVEDVFLVTGGGMMFLTDGIYCNERLNAIPCLHEQGASMAAISYAQYRESYSACFVTTGCGGTNAITGTLHAFQDHIPVIYISGQCNRKEMKSSVKVPVRSIGQQEADIVSIVKPITKYAVTIMDEKDAVYEIEKAIYIAKEGCWGPVWIDIPLDIQEAIINPNLEQHFNATEVNQNKIFPTKQEISQVVNALQNSVRPIIIMGAGIRDSKAINEFESFINKYQIPFVGTRRGFDILPKTNELNIGLADIRGNRAANFALQNADCILVLGSRLSMFTTGYNYDLFAREADKVIVVDIDPIEHLKDTVKIDILINSDIKSFLSSLPAIEFRDISVWREKCVHWKRIFSEFNEDQEDDTNGISKFAFISRLNKQLKDNSVVVTDAGATTEIPMQGLLFNSKKQRYLGSANQCEMGYAVPAIIGAGIARKKDEVIGIVGDGSLQMNIQELQTISTQKIPAKIFVWNNGGYATIRGHQKGLFHGHFLGIDASSGTAFPDLEKIAKAYNFVYYKVEKLCELESIMKQVLSEKVPVICDVICWKEEINPMVKARYKNNDKEIMLPPEDMFPPIDRDLFKKEMIINPIIWWE